MAMERALSAISIGFGSTTPPRINLSHRFESDSSQPLGQCLQVNLQVLHLHYSKQQHQSVDLNDLLRVFQTLAELLNVGYRNLNVFHF